MMRQLETLVEFFEKDNLYVQLLIEKSTPTSITYHKKKLDSIYSNEFQRGHIQFIYKGSSAGYSFYHFDLEKIKQEGSQILKTLQKTAVQPINIELTKIIQDSVQTKHLTDPSVMSLEQKNDLLYQYYQVLLKEDLSKIENTQAVYKDTYREFYFVNSQGSKIEQKKQFIGISLSALAKDGNNIQRGVFSHAMYGGTEVLEGHESEIQGTVKQARDLLTAQKLDKGCYNVILDNRMAGVFAHEAFGHTAEADFTSNNQSMLDLMTLGRKFGVEELNIIDDGSLESLAGYTPYDDQGVEAQKTYLIKDGLLNSLMHSRETAAKMNTKPTGNARVLNASYHPLVRMTNTYIDKGHWSKEQLFEKVKNGIYCCGFIGGMTNLESFTFTPAVSYIIKDGKIDKMCSNVMLSGNVFHTMNQISSVADDVQHYGTLGGCGKGGQNGLPVTIGGPHILLQDIVVG